MLTILCWGGIGDTLRNIGLVPHAWIHRTFGYRCRVVHRHWREAGCLPHAGAPEPEFFQELIGRIPSLEWRGESGEHRSLSRSLNRALRDVLKAINGGRPRYYPYELRLSETERAALPPKPAGPSIGLQTHLHGMLTKRWAAENWRAVLERLLAAYPASHLSLLDTAPEVEALCFDPRIRHTRGLNIAQSIALCGRCDLLVSIDSWTKYVGATLRVPQVIIVPDQRAEYPGLTAEKLVREEFAGIYGMAQNTILGISGPAQRPVLDLPEIKQLAPADVFAAIRRRLEAR
jgi:ADP-heptose:LPS heptosyltransferase